MLRIPCRTRAKEVSRVTATTNVYIRYKKKRQRKFDEAIPYPTGNSDQQIKVKISDTGNSKQIPPICNLTTQNIDMILL